MIALLVVVVVVVILMITTIGFTIILLAYFYRLSIKSTAIIWLPLIYVVRRSYDGSFALVDRLEDIRDSALWGLIRLISWITLALLITKIAFLPMIIEWWDAQVWAKILNVYVMPKEIHLWHVAAGTNALIALVGYYYFIEPAPKKTK